MTPLGSVPGARVTRYLGSVSLHFIKESWAASRGGEVASFFHEFVMEVTGESISVCRWSLSLSSSALWLWLLWSLFDTKIVFHG